MPPPASLDPSHRPRLRPTLGAEANDDGAIVFDPLRIGQSMQLTPIGFEIVRRFNGSHTLAEVQSAIEQLTGGQVVSLDALSKLIGTLDEALLLESPRFADRIGGPIRKPMCIGCYDADPNAMRSQLRKLFTASGGPGMPEATAARPHGKLRAALLPHMDYGRGNVTYGWGFKELVEQTDAAVFVILATSHYSTNRYTLTRQHFESPLGVVETDRSYIDRIETEYGPGLFDDPLAHIPEHSIELEVVLLQFLLEKRRPFKIVPLLCGSLRDCIGEKSRPSDQQDIAKMIAALKAAEAACSEEVCYLISGDLAHIGPKFGDEQRAEGSWLEASRKQDETILAELTRADSASYFNAIAAEGDERRLCGLPPTYLALETIRPRAGRVLHYQQFIDPTGHESVSFAAAAFYE